MDDSADGLFKSHQRDFLANRYVYPVLSRRAGGISIGVNLSPSKACNFDCAYCQVDRSELPEAEPIDLQRLAEELDSMLELVTSGRIFAETKFRDTPEKLRRLNDIALSGDGEPTLCADFEAAVAVAVEALQRRALADVKLVLITNATLLHQPRVERALKLLDTVNGQIWAKLDAGTEDYYRQVSRSPVPYQQILDNLCQAAVQRPIVIQTLFMRIHDKSPSSDEIEAYCVRLNHIVASGGRIELVQIHTVARVPTESWVSALGRDELDGIADMVARRTGLCVEASA